MDRMDPRGFMTMAVLTQRGARRWPPGFAQWHGADAEARVAG